jgi:glycerol-3-phosphate O-acyltransferase / dihydroxyacetone phosphate acyltransferase
MDFSRWITRTAGWAVGVFQTIERAGGPVPDGPVLVVANHPNSLIDPLVVFRVAGRTTRPLAKAPLFEQRFIGTMLRGLGGLPVYRAQDDPAQMHRNDDTFRGAIDALQRGEAVQMYPEGRSHSEPALAPLRTGAARIALAAESGSGWQLGLRIVPIGLTYYRKGSFRGRALAVVGEPFALSHMRAAWEMDEAAAVRALTDEIAARLHAVTVNLAAHRDAELIDTAERLYARQKGVSSWRSRDPLAGRLPRLRAFARGLAWLREHDAARHARLARAVARYRRRVSLLGADEGDVPPRYSVRDTARYALRYGLPLTLAAPVAMVGIIIWYPTYRAPTLTLRMVRPDDDAVATYKLATGLVMVPLTVAAGIAVGGLLYGAAGAAAAAVVVPALGLAALAWHDRWHLVQEDARLFFRVLGRREHADRLARDRAALTAEFDALAAEVDALPAGDTHLSGAPGGTSPATPG